jgi:hypothetical protein
MGSIAAARRGGTSPAMNAQIANKTNALRAASAITDFESWSQSRKSLA